jgi:hypothetical protein
MASETFAYILFTKFTFADPPTIGCTTGQHFSTEAAVCSEIDDLIVQYVRTVTTCVTSGQTSFAHLLASI